MPSIISVTDDVLPVTGALTSNATTNDPNLTVKVSVAGTGAVAGDTVQLYNGSGTGSQLGSWYTLTATDITNGFANVQTGTLTNGTTYAFTARITDATGNQSVASTSFTATEDTTTPVPTINSVTDDVPPGTSTVSSGGATNDTMPTLNGSAEANSTVTILDGVTNLGTVTANGSGAWTLATAVGQGGHSFTATAKDAAGNISGASGAFALSIDTAPPLAAMIMSVDDNVGPVTGPVSNGGSTDDTTPTLSGTAEAEQHHHYR